MIGSGVAGMAAAIRLAVEGYQVNVFERNEYPGGKLSGFKKDGYTFDSGPSLFTQPQNLIELFLLANEPIEEYLIFSKCDVACNYFYENGKTLTAWGNRQKFVRAMEESLGESAVAANRYLDDAEQLYNKTGDVFLNYSLHKKSTWLNKRFFKALSSVKSPYLFSTLNSYNKSRFKTPEATQLFNRYATYNGSNPYKAPAMLSLIPHLEHNEGTFYPKGGMINIATALYNLALKKGVVFHFNSPVESIIEAEGKCRGIVSRGENHFAAVVISNIDVYFTYKNLLSNSRKAAKVLRQERSSSALIFYWGVNNKFDQLGLHNIFFSENYKKEFDHIFDGRKLYSDPTVYVNITSKHDVEHAPSNAENWFVMLNVPANKGQKWDELKTQARKNIITKLNRILNVDLEQLIQSESVQDPLSIEAATGSYMGSLYGTSSNSKMAAFFRHPNYSKDIKGLYFCGGSVHPGGGIPLCFRSAKIVTGLIRKDFKTHH